MKTVFLLMDSLNRNALSIYGGAFPTPNFDRLAARGLVFDRHFVGSLPCMPARRDLMTGRLCFMHRSWGPLEPFDDAFPEILKEHSVYSHLATDHYHYFEDGGATYHNRFNSYDFIRGQEFDAWAGVVDPPHDTFEKQFHPLQVDKKRHGMRLQGLINRERIVEEDDYPGVKTFDAGLEFLRRNKDAENWILQLETFDPHEPFQAPQRLRERFATGYQGPTLDWPRYVRNELSEQETAELRANYTALVALNDEQLGRLLNDFDENDRWADTALILTSDHGFLLGEHDWWGKNQMPFYNEIANIPFIVHHPDFTHRAGQRVGALTQTIDIMPTLLDFHGAEIPKSVTGCSIRPLLESSQANIRDAAVYGIYAGAVNVTDGRHSYFRYPANMDSEDLYEYTLMPMHNYDMFEPRELQQAELHPPFDFTKDVPVLKIPALPDAMRSPRQGGFSDCETLLYDFITDPNQQHPIDNATLEAGLCSAIANEMALHDAPAELYLRWAIEKM